MSASKPAARPAETRRPDGALDLSPAEVAGLYPDPPARGAAAENRDGGSIIPGYRGEHPEPRFSFSEETEDELGGKRMTLNFGPQHPAAHGTLRIILEIEGERIVGADTEIGFLHTGFEKCGEHLSYQQWVTLSDRMNYMSAINNNVGYSIACEELLGITPPRRAQVIRVVLSEISRIADHILCLGLAGMDIGAFSLMLWAFERREKIYDLLEIVTGTRLTTSYTRIGGLFRDVPEDFPELVESLTKEFPRFVDELRTMTHGNRIFEERLRGTGIITAEEAVNWGLTGPVLRASGVAYDVRKAQPYSGYERYDFDVPTQPEGDSWARFILRLAEIEQSVRIIEQAMEDLPEGPVNVDNKKIALPDKAEVYQNIESLIHHFKQIMFGHGILPPRGAEVYSVTESPNGELGYYLVSNGEMCPYRLRVRPPSFFHFAIYPKIIQRLMLSDAVAILATLNVIAGELDR
jgi:NADH dehydrogenase I D subunit